MREAYLLMMIGIGLQASVSEAMPANSLLPPLSSQFGYRRDPINHRAKQHQGIDIPAATGTPVLAAASGVVAFAGVRQGYGLTIDVVHANNRKTRYAHLSRLAAKSGDEIEAAALIGFVGATGRATGPHLHFEYWIAGKAVDPLPYLNLTTQSAENRLKEKLEISQHFHVSAYARLSSCRQDQTIRPDDEIPLGAQLDCNPDSRLQ